MARGSSVRSCRALGICALLSGAFFPAAASALDTKIGVLTDMTGTFSDLSGEGSVIATRMAVEDFGAAAKGLNVQIVVGDHQNKPDVGSAIAREWFERDNVDAVFDVPNSSVGLAVNGLARQFNKTYVNTGAGTTLLTGKECSPNTIMWSYDTWAFAHGTVGALLKRGETSWYFLTADYTFGHSLEAEASDQIVKSGGTVLGNALVPFINRDFSSYLLQAQASGAKVVGLANSGADAVNAVKQAHEYGITAKGQTLAALLLMIVDVHALGPETAQGLVLTEPFYWDLNDDTRKWSKRFAAMHDGVMPTSEQAGTYSGVLHYLKAAVALGSVKDGVAVIKQMKSMPTDDPIFGKGTIRPDGRKLHPMYLFQVKGPEESKGEWDLYKLLATIPPDQAFRAMSPEECPLAKAN